MVRRARWGGLPDENGDRRPFAAGGGKKKKNEGVGAWGNPFDDRKVVAAMEGTKP